MLRTFIYKRTHEGDPDECGRFGCCDCMGRLRKLNYGAVIGLGGIGREAIKNGIAGKVTWIGRGPRRTAKDNLVTFDQFFYFGSKGPNFCNEAPLLSRRMFSKNAPRFLLDDFNPREKAEIEKLLARASKISSHLQSKETAIMKNYSRSDMSRCSQSVCRKKR